MLGGSFAPAARSWGGGPPSKEAWLDEVQVKKVVEGLRLRVPKAQLESPVAQNERLLTVPQRSSPRQKFGAVGFPGRDLRDSRTAGKLSIFWPQQVTEVRRVLSICAKPVARDYWLLGSFIGHFGE